MENLSERISNLFDQFTTLYREKRVIRLYTALSFLTPATVIIWICCQKYEFIKLMVVFFLKAGFWFGLFVGVMFLVVSGGYFLRDFIMNRDVFF